MMARSAEFSDAPWARCANNFGPPSFPWSDHMATIHEEIDNWLAADLHGELSNDERSALHTHLHHKRTDSQRNDRTAECPQRNRQ